MAALNKIRSKAGLLVIVVGVALLAFILSDLLNSCQSFLNLGKDKVFSVNGKSVTVSEFQLRAGDLKNRYEQQAEQQNRNLTEEELERINQETYNQMVVEMLLEQECDKLGFTVCDEELTDLFRGEQPHYLVLQRFGNPQTGKLDQEQLDEYVNVLFHPGDFGIVNQEQLARIEYEKQLWIEFEQQVKQTRLQDKLYNLLNRSVTPNKLDVKASFNENKMIADIAFVKQSYGTIADSTVVIDNNELKDEYNRVKESLKTPETRRVKYIAIDVKPSDTDRAALEAELNDLQAEFASTTDMSQFLGYNSDVAYNDAFFAASAFSGKLKTFIEGAAVNDVSELDLAGNVYNYYRLMSSKVAPDSIEVRFMAFDPTTTEMDSVLIALKAGGDMESVANARNAQVYNQWFVEAMALNNESVKTLVDRIFAETGSNYFTVETFAGNYIVQVLNRTKPVKKVKVAILSKTLMPSEKTNTNYYNQLSAYVAEHGDAETFVSGAKEAGFFVREADCVAELAMLPNLPGTREIIRWAFDSKAGKVSEIYTIGNNEAFVVAALENVVKEGYIPFEDAKEFLTQRVLPAKKAEKIIADLNAKELTSLEAYAQAMNTQVGNAQFITFNTPSIQGVGVEPALNGLIFNAEQGKLVGPVQGRDGVYVFTVTNKTESQEPFNAEAEAQSVQAVYNNALQQVVNVLYNKADISNKTYRFF